MNKFTRTILVCAIAFAATQASAAEFGQWHQVQPGVIERINSDGTGSRATYGNAGAQYNYERLQARIAEIESGKAGVLDSLSALQSAYAALGVAASARLAQPDAAAANDDWLAPMKKAGPVINAADYSDAICTGHLAEFWSTYTNMFASASLVVTATLSSGGFSPPPPAITQWSVTADASFLTTSGGTWNNVHTDDYNPSGDKTSTASNGASRTGYCDGYSLGQVSVFCPGGGSDYASYEQFYPGCP